MTDTGSADTDALLDRVCDGDSRAVNELLHRHRHRIRSMVNLRISPELVSRVDPSDIVQEALAEASVSLASYARQRPVAFYPWLRNIAWQRLVAEYRRHVVARNRSVRREEPVELELPDQSEAILAERFSKSQTSPSGAVVRGEMQQRLHSAMGKLASADREVLILRYLEQMSMREIAETLGIREDAARQRHTRALLRLQQRFSKDNEQ